MDRYTTSKFWRLMRVEITVGTGITNTFWHEYRPPYRSPTTRLWAFTWHGRHQSCSRYVIASPPPCTRTRTSRDHSARAHSMEVTVRAASRFWLSRYQSVVAPQEHYARKRTPNVPHGTGKRRQFCGGGPRNHAAAASIMFLSWSRSPTDD
ncbi:hypothetical protein FH972_022159 [Carpinus fangiana]|uniref:Uncharacterized protein n=1 Tax=Carpinus fangiana TaxID=176857 RepID=A0A5N6KRF8_9ROSI|nr:hypothetical protein FH972_022159 [Carpinus fangiana]